MFNMTGDDMTDLDRMGGEDSAEEETSDVKPADAAAMGEATRKAKPSKAAAMGAAFSKAMIARSRSPMGQLFRRQWMRGRGHLSLSASSPRHQNYTPTSQLLHVPQRAIVVCA